MTAKYTDIQILNGEFVLDAGLNPELLTDRDVIAQDVVHAIIETGLAHQLIGQRSPSNIADVKTQIKLLVEDDVRIMPGTVRVEQSETETYWVFADTIEFGSIESKLITGVNAQ